MKKEIFKAYDIRGIYPTEIDEEAVYLIAKAYATWLKPKKVALGRDVRLSGEELFAAAARGLTEMGVDVVDIGVISTDMLYFTVAHYGLDGGITISASHNSGEYNGMKLVREASKPISIESGISEIREIAFSNKFVNRNGRTGSISVLDIFGDYINKVLSLVDGEFAAKFRVVANVNYGASGSAVSKIAEHFGVELTKLNFEPNGSFPKGKPDPLQPSNREETEALIRESNVDFGITWDADADRCFFYDELGNFIHPYYITALQMEYFLSKNPNSKIIIDPRFIWLAQDIADKFGAALIINKSGHSFIKERMRTEDVLFAAEASAHYYYRDLWYTDNGLVPWLVVMDILSQKEPATLSRIIAQYQAKYYAAPETNFSVQDVPGVIARLKEKYSSDIINEIDGYSAEFADWRFNVRGSNTEPVVRLCVEARNEDVGKLKLKELSEVINGL